MERGLLLTEAHEKVRNVHHVRGVSSGIVIHFVTFSRLVLDDVREHVDCRLVVLGCRAISAANERPGWIGERECGDR